MQRQRQPQTSITIPVHKSRPRKRSNGDTHVGLARFKLQKSEPTNWGEGSNGILEHARVLAAHALKLDQHIDECSTKSRTRRRAIKAYRSTIERLRMAIQYQKPKEQLLNAVSVNEALNLAHELIEKYTARMEQLSHQEDIPKLDSDVMDGFPEEEEDDEEGEGEEGTDSGNETVTASQQPRCSSAQRTAARRNTEDQCAA